VAVSSNDRRVQARTRVLVFVLLAAIGAAAATVGLTALTSDPRPNAETLCPEGPPLTLDLGLRVDREAVALRRAQRLLAEGDQDGALAASRPFTSVDARVAAAVASWPRATLAQLRALAAEQPRNPTVALHLGNALYCDRRGSEAQAQWRTASRLAPDSLIGVRASDFLNPRYPIPGIPVFVPGFRFPPRLAALPARRQFAALAASARRSDVRSKLLYGVALQQLSRQRSAETQYAAAARLAPNDPEALVAAAVGRFDKNRPSDAFSRLGPLARKFPRAATVRFHLGLLLLWLGQTRAAEPQFARAIALEPGSRIASQAARYRTQLEKILGRKPGLRPSS
jgi:tetratricopeptide (TPR) repeat protein